MKTILSFSAVVLLATAMCITSAEAKGKGGGGTTKSSGGKGKGNSVDAYLKAHDKNKNGTIEPSEFQGARSEFDKWDTSKDGKLDRSELSAMLSKK